MLQSTFIATTFWTAIQVVSAGAEVWANQNRSLVNRNLGSSLQILR
jgi:phenylacetate-coenzyme A ligase PaaK-like adenylate-forming protein